MDDFFVPFDGDFSSQEIYAKFLELDSKIQKSQVTKKLSDVDRSNLLKMQFSSKTKGMFRSHSSSNDLLKALWVSKVNKSANFFEETNKVTPFSGLSASKLSEIAKLSVSVESLKNITNVLLDLGIILVVEPNIQGAKVDGYVALSFGGRPIVGLSLRYSRYDNFWFTLLHELSHIVLHGAILEEGMAEVVDKNSTDAIEVEANILAANSIIPRNLWRKNPMLKNPVESELNEFCTLVEVHPILVAGRLRHELNRHDIFTDLVHSIDVRSVFY